MPDPEPEPMSVNVEANGKATARVVTLVVQDEQHAQLTPEEFHQVLLDSNARCIECYAPGTQGPGERANMPTTVRDQAYWRHLIHDRSEIIRTPSVVRTPKGMAHEAFHDLLRGLGRGTCYLCRGDLHYLKASLAVVLVLGAVALAGMAGGILVAVGASLIVDRGLQSTGERRAGISSTGLGAAWDAMGFSDNPAAFAAGNTELVIGTGTARDVFALDATPTRTGQVVSYVRTLTSAQALYTIKQVALLNGGAGVFTALCAGIDSLSLLHGAFKMKFTIELTDSN